MSENPNPQAGPIGWLDPSQVAERAFGETGQGGMSRRQFLKATGFTFVGAMVFGCSTAPEETALGYLEQPEGPIAGRADHYATTCAGCSAGCGILAKSRDGRPIKLEGNPQHPVSRGGLCAVGQAALLGLYDARRLHGPLAVGQPLAWEAVDREIAARLDTLRRRGGRLRYLSGPVLSPSKQALVDEFVAIFPDGKHVIYDPSHDAAVLDAHRSTHGVRIAPRLRFDQAAVIVSIDADFLGTWVSPVQFTGEYASRRQADLADGKFSLHVQFESRMSITGSKADRRHVIAPHERAAILCHLLDHVERMGQRTRSFSSLPPCSVDEPTLQSIAEQLWAHRGESLVVCGAADVDSQIVCNTLNQTLGNYGATVDLVAASRQIQGDESALADLVREIRSGQVDAILVDGVNPLFDLPGAVELARAFVEIPLRISFAPRADETAAACEFVCPDAHFLETWGDAEPLVGTFSFTQPLVRGLATTRPVIESLDRWLGRSRSTREILQARWGSGPSWDRRIHDGYEVGDAGDGAVATYRPQAVLQLGSSAPGGTTGLALVLYTKAGMPNGSHAFNPWLQELPDPVTKAVWDNYACLSPRTAERLGVIQGDVVRVAVGSEAAIELPALVQPGQHDDTVAVALGYGSELSRRFADVGPEWIERRSTVGDHGLVGVNAAPLLVGASSRRVFCGSPVDVHKTGRRQDLALTQDYQYIEVPAHLAPPGAARRPNIKETTLAALTPHGEHAGDHERPNLWPPDHQYTGHHWAMVIDLTTCTGCSACVVACQVENNIPVVGKDEVRRNREMHWLRIDRYYSEGAGGTDVAHQPMLCQHCDNAPCETVCPVLATVHSDEGLNQQVYNRCVGTRYCMNNCPYKVRRFNWFEYAREDEHANLTLNPDVTIRSRGIMEKCSFCAQRIHEQKELARMAGTPLADSAIRTACEQSCPAQAIIFGDRNDPESKVAKAISSQRHYRVLDDLNVRPSVGYLSIVRWRGETKKDGHHG